MLTKLKSIYKNNSTLLNDNFILLAANAILGLAGFLYHFFMGRALGPVNYGFLGPLTSIINIFIVFYLVLITATAKFVSEFKAKKEFGKISYLLKSASKQLWPYQLIAFALFVGFIPFLASFLKFPTYFPLFITGLAILVLPFLALHRGVLQGFQRFNQFSFTLILEGAGKLFFGVLFVLFGLSVAGAIGGFICGIFFSYFLARFYTKDVLRYKQIKCNLRDFFYSYSVPVYLAIMGFTLLFSVDVLIVKHFLTAVEAGYYTALSLLGKAIYFICLPITYVMFPKAVEAKTLGDKAKPILYKSLGIVMAIVIPILLAYFFLPSFIVSIAFGQEYMSIAPFIGIAGLFGVFLTLNFNLVFYNLSMHRKWFIVLIFLADILEIVLISLFHVNVAQVIYSLVATGSLLFFALLFTLRK